MKKLAIITLAVVVGFCLSTNVFAETATKEEVIAKCKEAADMVKADKAAGIAEIAKKDGKFVWKDTYVFAMDLNGKMLAHPIKPALTEKDTLFGTPDKNTEKPKMIFDEFVKVAKEKGEGWVDYMWPKPGEEAPAVKDTYILKVQDADILVGAGIYK
jgi:signal transduction histidine kinase